MLAMSMSKVALAQAKRLALLIPWPCTPERLRMLMLAGLGKSTAPLPPKGLSPKNERMKRTDSLEVLLWR